MPYVVLARRGRPQLFSDVVGQEHVTKTIQNAISSGRIAHAYLFTGPRGVGKTTIARIFAKAVNCKFKKDSEPCNECNSCVEISAGRSIDIIEIDAASNRGIDEIRELRENVKFAPVSTEYKVYIIDEVHMLTIEAFNALLKTLEEPPHHVIFILATTEAHKIPATILSRCQRFDFRILNRGEIIDRLRELLVADNLPVNEDALSLIAENADGALRDAESILDQMLSFSDGDLKTDEVSRFLGLGSYQLLDSLVDNVIKCDSAKSLEAINSLADHGADLPQCLKKLVSYFRDLMIYKINPDLIDVSETRSQRLMELSKSASVDRLMKTVKILTQTESEIKQLGYERLNFELAIIRLCRLRDESIQLDKVLTKLQEIESKVYNTSGIPATVVAEPENAYSDVTVGSVDIVDAKSDPIETKESDPLGSTWANILKSIKSTCSQQLLAFLREASLVSFDDSTIVIDFDAKFSFHREQINEQENKKQIEASLSDSMGKPIKLVLQSNNTANKDPKNDVPTSQREMRTDAMLDDSVKLVLDIFNGRIIDVKR
jgi:DNA polymerase III subunit gamma/tau